MILSLDTETTGLDIYHAARPFLVTVCFEDAEQEWWEWDVNPLNREVQVPYGDVREISRLIGKAKILVLQNPKFDYAALRAAHPDLIKNWDWSKVRDTLMAGHLLCSNARHDLTAMTVEYLRGNIQPYEDRVEKIVQTARRRARTHCPKWRIAKKDEEGMPSAKDETWKHDMWLPKTIAPVLREIKGLEDEDYSGWDTVTEDYANIDSYVTLEIWKKQEPEIRRRKLWAIYETRLKLLPVASEMETRGITVNKSVLYSARNRMRTESLELEKKCVNIARSTGYELKLPKSGVNKSLREYVFEHRRWFDLYSAGGGKVMKTKGGNPALDKNAIAHYGLVIRKESKDGLFLASLAEKRRRDTAIGYMNAYERFWIPLFGVSPFDGAEEAEPIPGWYTLHPSLNPTGTHTLRWSSSNPNEQNISKQKGFSTRIIFGPAPGREWYTFDAKNIELRIPAYDAPEPEMIALFEKPDEPPYYGSNHLLNFHTAYPDIWEREAKKVGYDNVGKHCKKEYEASWYRWCKEGGFAKLYGAGEVTVDLAFRRKGVNALLNARFSKLDAHNRRCIRFAQQHGYVETVPDKTVDPERGYPVMCTRTERFGILSTVPLNYRTQSTAMWWMGKAMIRVQDFLWSLNRGEKFAGKKWPGGYYIPMQVHDELGLDAPSGLGKGKEQYEYNLPIVREVRRLMELGGDDISIPTPVGCQFHPVNWAEGVDIEQSL